MKRILLLLVSFFIYSVCFATSIGGYRFYATPDGSTYVKTCSTFTATQLFDPTTEPGIETVGYDNKTSGTIYISTYAATSATGNIYAIGAGEKISIDSTAWKYGLAETTANADLTILIVK